MSTVLYIDGENIKHYLKTVLINSGVTEKKLSLENFSYFTLFDRALRGIALSERRYYLARIRVYQDSIRKSKNLILKQRIQKANLEKSDIKVIVGGNVRGQEVKINGKRKTVFHEKGVDVKIAVDLVAEACDHRVTTAILCSSDSDLQPAVKEARLRGVEVIYLGFELNPNKGLSYTTSRTILIRNSEVLEVHAATQRMTSKK